MLPCFIALSVLLASSWLYVRTFSRRRGRLPLPPGPPASWFGSVQGLPQSHRWLKYAEWTKLYGKRVIELFQCSCDILLDRGPDIHPCIRESRPDPQFRCCGGRPARKAWQQVFLEARESYGPRAVRFYTLP